MANAGSFRAPAAKVLAAGDWLIVPDAPGLRLVASGAHRTWVYRYKSPVDGRMRQVRLGRWPAMGLPAAMAAWSDAQAQRNAGADLSLQRRQRRAALSSAGQAEAYTVRRMAAEWLAAWRGGVAPKTAREAERLLSRELDAIADTPAAELTRAQVFDLLEPMRDARPVVAAGLRQAMGAATDRALDAGRVPGETPNWWRLILRGKLASRGKIIGGQHQGQPVKRALSLDELRALLPWWPNWSRDVGDALALVLWTGCRGAEVCAMRAEQITEEADGHWWTIPRAALKMRRNPLLTDLRVPLVGRALSIVQRRVPLAREGWVFPSPGRSGHIEQKALGVAVWVHRATCTSQEHYVRARLPTADWAPHDLRRTVRTQLAALGCPQDVAEAILGHMLPGVQGAYNRHQYDAERRLWLTRWAGLLGQIEVSGAGAPSADF